MKYLLVIVTGAVFLHSSLLVAADTCLPLTIGGNIGPLTGLCATSPGTVSSDGFDDVCLLVTCCVNRGQIAIELPSGHFFPCLYANCSSICSLSQTRSTLGGEACLSTCTPPPPPPPPDLSCYQVLIGRIASLIPGIDLLIPGYECGRDLVGLKDTVPFKNCYAGCSCSTNDNGCDVQNEGCSVSCGFTLVPQTCVDFLSGVVWDLFGRIGKDVAFLVQAGKVQQVWSNFEDALKCILSPGPF